LLLYLCTTVCIWNIKVCSNWFFPHQSRQKCTVHTQKVKTTKNIFCQRSSVCKRTPINVSPYKSPKYLQPFMYQTIVWPYFIWQKWKPVKEITSVQLNIRKSFSKFNSLASRLMKWIDFKGINIWRYKIFLMIGWKYLIFTWPFNVH
jgi:hypothetical protein